MKEDNNYLNSFEEELEKIKSNTVLSPEYKRKKLILWFIRTLIAVCLYFFSWKYTWVRWSLIVYIPLNLISLISIFGWNIFLNKKINTTRNVIIESEKQIRAFEEE